MRFSRLFHRNTKRQGADELLAAHESSLEFSRRLTVLSEVVNGLSQAESLDALCRRVAEEARDRLNFERLALWFLSDDRQTIHGTYGVDSSGQITDERSAKFKIDPSARIWPVLQGQTAFLLVPEAPLYSDGRLVGQGMRLSAGLWNGTTVIGFLSADNQRSRRPFDDSDCEILRLYAASVGHLCTLKRSEEERGRLQEQLIQAHKMESVGRLAGGVAHDFNNMLSVIIGVAEMAMSRLDPSDALQEDLKEIHAAAKRSADLTCQLLAFARKQFATPRVLELNAVVADALRMLERLIGEGIRLTWKPGRNLWDVLMDPVQLEQVLANLAVNSRDAVGATGTIVIRTDNETLDGKFCEHREGCVPGDYVLLSVTDDGCGMDAETVSHIFEPFFTTKTSAKGTGLGLATVYGIVRQNGGTVTVESESGRGTTMSVYLPRYLGTVREEQSAAEDDVKKEGSETILLVEDEPMILQVNGIYLKRLGYKVLTAGSPIEALRVAATYDGRIHLLLTDVIMPVMSGRDLARELEAVRPGLICLFMSGYADGAIGKDGILVDGVHFIQKPFGLNELGVKIRGLLNRTGE